MKFLVGLVVILSLSASFITWAEHQKAAPGERVYTLAVVPQFSNVAIHKNWTPIVNYLEKSTGKKFKLVFYKSIPEFETGFLNGEPDFAYMNPYHAVMAKRAHGYRPIIRDSARLLTGILVVRKDSGISSYKQLDGQTIAFPSPNAFAAALYMRALLKEKLNIEFTPYYAKTHSNAYRQVLLGKTKAAGGVFRTLRKERAGVGENLQVIFKTPSTPSHPLTVHARVPGKLATQVQSAILAMQKDKQYSPYLKAVLIPKPIKTEYDKDYRFLENLKLEKYVVR